MIPQVNCGRPKHGCASSFTKQIEGDRRLKSFYEGGLRLAREVILTADSDGC